MQHYVNENRAEIFSPIYKEYSQNLNRGFEMDYLFSKLSKSKKFRTIHCNSFLAEEAINIIIDYFNEQSHLNANFKMSVLDAIKDIEFAYPTDNEKLKSIIEINSGNSLIASRKGMKSILNAFIKYSDFTANSNNNYFENINYVIEPANEVYESATIWVEQTISEPWFK